MKAISDNAAAPRADPVFILGQGAGLVIYLRNLHLIHSGAKAGESEASR